jgi:quercetin dioxygenase-like cupin family protein
MTSSRAVYATSVRPDTAPAKPSPGRPGPRFAGADPEQSCDHRLMDVASINELAADGLGKAVSSESGRSSVTVYSRPGARLRQTLTALAAGRVMGEHKSPGDASLVCLQGRVRLRAGDTEVDLGPGDLVAVPPQRHDIEALEPSVLLLTVALH